MKRLAFAVLFFVILSSVSSVLASQNQYFILPEAVPYTYQGHTYTNVLAVYTYQYQNRTQIEYCDAEFYVFYSPTNDDFYWTCGQIENFGTLPWNWSHNSNANGMSCAYQDGAGPYCYPYSGWNYSNVGGTLDSDVESNFYSSIPVYNWDDYGLTQAFPVLTPFSFPLDKDCSGVPCTPYTAPVSSVMDHSMTTPYDENDTVLAFNGEVGEKTNGYNLGCYANSESTSFDMDINYIGTYATGGSYYLCYDGHPGYDYPASAGTDINAPADGTLCVATSTTQQPYPVDVWRDTTHCPYSTAGSTSWSGYHTFYIIHEGLYINGSTNDYMTVFLHSDDLESSVRDEIEQNGYATVTKNQHIAESGDVGSSGSYHIHIEVYKKNGENWDRVDPYGDGTNNVLWEQN